MRENKIIKMKKLIYLLGLVIILMSCKTSKANCDAYSSYEKQKDSTNTIQLTK
jgi:PBP1b-binding outer membrane lipoprotein LpoB